MKRKGFSYYRTPEQIREYIKVPAVQKLEWLEEMWMFNLQVARKNPTIAKIQNKFRRGEL